MTPDLTDKQSFVNSPVPVIPRKEKGTRMKNFLKFFWYYLKRCGMFLGIQLIITLLGFIILMINSDIAHIIIGIAVVILNCFFYFLIGKSAALNDFKFKRINAAKFGGKPPYYEACKEMKLSKAAITAGAFYVVNLILVLFGSYVNAYSGGSALLRGLIMFEFMGVMLISSGTGFSTVVNGVEAVEAVAANPAEGIVGVEAVAAVAGKPYLFPALFMPVILLICASYVGGYFLSMTKRNRQHREIQDEIAMFDRMGKV